MSAVASGVPWWQAVFFNGVGAAFISGIFAVAIARLTVRWTRTKDAKARTQERSREAAQAVTAALMVATPKVKLLPPGESPDLTELQRVLGIELAVITDPELVQRVSSLWKAMVELAVFNSCIQSPTPANEPQVPPNWPLKKYKYALALADLEMWVGESLAAHRIGKPLPIGTHKLPALTFE